MIYLFLAILANFITWWFEPLEPVRTWVEDRLPKNWIGSFLQKELFCPRCQGFAFAIIYAIVTADLIALMVVPFLADIVHWVLAKVDE